MSPQISNRVSKSLWRGFMASVCVLMLFNGDASAFTVASREAPHQLASCSWESGNCTSIPSATCSP